MQGNTEENDSNYSKAIRLSGQSKPNYSIFQLHSSEDTEIYDYHEDYLRKEYENEEDMN